MRKKTKIILVTTISASLLGYLTWQAENPDVTSELNAESISEADYFLEQVNMSQFDQAGNLLNRLQAKSLSHFAKDNLSLIQAPNVYFSDQNNAQWQIESLNGKLNHAAQQIELTHAINIQLTTNNQQTQILTDALLVDLQNKTADTDESIKIFSGQYTTNATGMFADINLGTIELKQQVQSQRIVESK